MKNKKNIAITAFVSIVLIFGISYYIGNKKNNSENVQTQLKNPALLPYNDRRYNYDSFYYHKNRNCTNHQDRDYISEYASDINGLLASGKKPCTVCVPDDEAKENREGRNP